MVIAGGTGFIGAALSREFTRLGYSVVVLTRTPRGRDDAVREIAWDGQHLGEWVQALDGAEAVINLAGKNINCPHTPENLKAITASRVNSVNVIAAASHHVKIPPPVWIQASAVGYYGDTGDATCDEQAAAGNNSLAQICQEWEGAFARFNLAAVRKVTLRIGFVLGTGGGALPVLASLARIFLGGAAGRGRQYISWIHLADLVRMFTTAVESPACAGTFNAVAPRPVTNAEFMRALRRALHRPWSPPAPEFAVRLGARLMGGEPSLALVSQRCVPARFIAAGFQYRFPELPPALRDLCQPN
jgi:uncharacterized protein (TIGR01777 family)